jgi:hypothetical protein
MNKPLASVARSRIRSRSLDTPIAGAGGWLDVGTHDVTITDVDLGRLESQGCIEFTFENSARSKHSQRVWLLKNEADEYSAALVNLVNSVFQDPTVYELLDQMIANSDLQAGTFQAFRGLRLSAVIDRSTGYTINQCGGKFVVVDAHTDVQLIDTEFASITAARDAAVARKLTKSYRRIIRYGALDDVTLSKNRKSFDLAAQSMLTAAASVATIRQIFDPATLTDLT